MTVAAASNLTFDGASRLKDTPLDTKFIAYIDDVMVLVCARCSEELVRRAN